MSCVVSLRRWNYKVTLPKNAYTVQTLSTVRMHCGQTLGKNEKAVPLVFLDAKCKWPHKFFKCIACIVRHTVYGCLWAKLWISIQPRTAPEAILRRNMLW